MLIIYKMFVIEVCFL